MLKHFFFVFDIVNPWFSARFRGPLLSLHSEKKTALSCKSVSFCASGHSISLTWHILGIVGLYHKERKQWTEAIICDELACTAEIPEKFLREWKQRKDDHRKRCLKVEKGPRATFQAAKQLASLFNSQTSLPHKTRQDKTIEDIA